MLARDRAGHGGGSLGGLWLPCASKSSSLVEGQDTSQNAWQVQGRLLACSKAGRSLRSEPGGQAVTRLHQKSSTCENWDSLWE